MELKPLEDIGLTPKEADVYLALVGMKSVSMSEIMARANVSRKSIYEIMQRLLDRGLVSYTIKDGKKRFNAANPERLLEILKKKEENLRAVLPEILAKYREDAERTTVEVFLGIDGIRTVSDKILAVRKPMYAVSGNAEMHSHLKYYTPAFVKKRVLLNIKRSVVYNEGVRKMNLDLPLTEIRYVPEEYNSPIQFTVYGDNVNLLIYSDVPVAVHIQNSDIAKSFMNHFKLMWAIGKK